MNKANEIHRKLLQLLIHNNILSYEQKLANKLGDLVCSIRYWQLGLLTGPIWIMHGIDVF